MKRLFFTLLTLTILLGASVEAFSQREERSRNDEEISSFNQYFWWGANTALQFSGGNQSSFFLVALEPMMGYKIDPKGNFSVGPKLTLEYTSIRYFGITEKVNSLNYGGGLFGRAKVYRQYFAHVEYEKLNETIAFTDGSTAREWNDNYFLGGGISQGDDKVKFEILILLNLNPESTAFNQTPVEYRFGFNVNF